MESEVVQITDAYERHREHLPVVCRTHDAEEAAFLFSLMKDDTVELEKDGTRAFIESRSLRLQARSPSSCEQCHARQDAIHNRSSMVEDASNAKANVSRKIVIDLLGKVHPAND